MDPDKRRSRYGYIILLNVNSVALGTDLASSQDGNIYTRSWIHCNDTWSKRAIMDVSDAVNHGRGHRTPNENPRGQPGLYPNSRQPDNPMTNKTRRHTLPFRTWLRRRRNGNHQVLSDEVDVHRHNDEDHAAPNLPKPKRQVDRRCNVFHRQRLPSVLHDMRTDIHRLDDIDSTNYPAPTEITRFRLIFTGKPVLATHSQPFALYTENNTTTTNKCSNIELKLKSKRSSASHCIIVYYRLYVYVYVINILPLPYGGLS